VLTVEVEVFIKIIQQTYRAMHIKLQHTQINKSSAVAEMGDRLATKTWAKNWGPCPFWGRGVVPPSMNE